METRTIGVWGLWGVAVVLFWAAAGDVRAEARERPAPDEAVFVQYCSGCHGSDARGGADGTGPGPDLTHLALESRDPGMPLALTRWVEFVTSPRRPGAQRICGERVFARLPSSRFREHAERWVVREALSYVAVQQQAE